MAATVAAASQNGGNSTYQVTRPAGTVEGDLLVASVCSDWATAAQNPLPDGFTALTTSQSSAGTNTTHVLIGYRIATGSEPASYTVTPGGAADNACGIIRVTGADGTPTVAQVAPTTSGTAPSLTPNAGDDLLLCFYGGHGNGNARSWTPPTGMSEHVDVQSNGAWATLHIASLQSPPSPTGTRTATPSGGITNPRSCTISIASASVSIPSGSATGAWSAPGVASGSAQHTGTASGAWSTTGSASGSTVRSGSAVGGWQVTGTASGTAPAVDTASGSASGGWTVGGSATGHATHSGTAVGSWSITGSASGTTIHRGSGAGSWAVAGTASGTAPTPGVSSGSAAGTWAVAGTASGTKHPSGAAFGTWVAFGAASGSAHHHGSSSGIWVVTGSASGHAPGSYTPAGAPIAATTSGQTTAETVERVLSATTAPHASTATTEDT